MILISGTNIGGVDPFKGLIYGLLAAIFYASLMILNKLIKGFSSLELTIIELFFAGIVMFIYVLFTNKEAFVIPSGKPLVILLLIGIVHTGIACYLYFSSMQELPGQTVAMFSYIDPVSALIFSGILLTATTSWKGDAVEELQALQEQIIRRCAPRRNGTGAPVITRGLRIG